MYSRIYYSFRNLPNSVAALYGRRHTASCPIVGGHRPPLQRASSFLDLDCVNVRFAKEVGSEDNPFPVWRKGDVRLEAVIVCGQIDKSFGIDGVTGPIRRPEQIDPLSIAGSRNALRPSAISGEKFSVVGDIEVDGPFLAWHFEPDLLAGLEDKAGKPEFLSLGSLQVIPDDFAVGAEELMACNLHIHGSGVNFAQA